MFRCNLSVFLISDIYMSLKIHSKIEMLRTKLKSSFLQHPFLKCEPVKFLVFIL